MTSLVSQRQLELPAPVLPSRRPPHRCHGLCTRPVPRPPPGPLPHRRFQAAGLEDDRRIRVPSSILEAAREQEGRGDCECCSRAFLRLYQPLQVGNRKLESEEPVNLRKFLMINNVDVYPLRGKLSNWCSTPLTYDRVDSFVVEAPASVVPVRFASLKVWRTSTSLRRTSRRCSPNRRGVATSDSPAARGSQVRSVCSANRRVLARVLRSLVPSQQVEKVFFTTIYSVH